MENNKIFLAGMEALRDSRNFTIRKKQYPLLTELSNSLHWHDFCEIEVITGGSGQHLVDGVCYPLHRGCAYLLTAKDFHNVREDPENPLSLYNINFNDQILPAELANEFNQSDDLFCVTFSEEDIRRVEQLAEDLLQEYEGSRLHRDEMSWHGLRSWSSTSSGRSRRSATATRQSGRKIRICRSIRSSPT